MRAWSIVFGIGLVILWLTGLNDPNSAAWLTWLDGLAGILAFVISASIAEIPSRRAALGGPLALSIGLFALWMAGLVSSTPAWQHWWTFVFGCGFLVLALGGGKRPGALRSTEIRAVEEKERFRKGA